MKAKVCRYFLNAIITKRHLDAPNYPVRILADSIEIFTNVRLRLLKTILY